MKLKLSKDIRKPIIEDEQLDKLLEDGVLPVVFIKTTIGSGRLKKTARMKKARLNTSTWIESGRCYNAAFPEKVIVQLVMDYCNRYPDPKILLERVKKAINEDIKVESTKQQGKT